MFQRSKHDLTTNVYMVEMAILETDKDKIFLETDKKSHFEVTFTVLKKI